MEHFILILLIALIVIYYSNRHNVDNFILGPSVKLIDPPNKLLYPYMSPPVDIYDKLGAHTDYPSDKSMALWKKNHYDLLNNTSI